MLGDNLENLLRIMGVNEIPQEVVEDNKVYMDFHRDLFSFFQECLTSISFLSNSIRRVTQKEILCELRECVNGEWCRVKLSIEKSINCRVSLEILGKDKYSYEEGFQVRGDI